MYDEFEYSILTSSELAKCNPLCDEVTALNNLGREGWELTSIIRTSNSTNIYYFKRKL